MLCGEGDVWVIGEGEGEGGVGAGQGVVERRLHHLHLRGVRASAQGSTPRRSGDASRRAG